MHSHRREHGSEVAPPEERLSPNKESCREQDLLGNAFLAERLKGAGAPTEPKESGETEGDPRSMPEKLEALRAGLAAAEAIMRDPDETVETVEAQLPDIVATHGMQFLELDPDGPHRYRPFGKVNPVDRGDGVLILEEIDFVILALWLRDLDKPDIHPAVVRVIAEQLANRFGPMEHEKIHAVRDAIRRARARAAAGDGVDVGNVPMAFLQPAVVDDDLDDAGPPAQQAAVQLDAPMGAELVDDEVAVGFAEDGVVDAAAPVEGDVNPAEQEHEEEVDVLPAYAQGEGSQEVWEAEPVMPDPVPRRATRQAWRDEEMQELAALRIAILSKAELFVTAPAGDEDIRDAAGGLAHTVRAPHDIKISCNQVPVIPDNRAAGVKTDYVYTEGDHEYTIRIVEPTVRGRVPELAGDTDFEIIRVNPPMTKTATGRAYTGDQAFYPNPLFQGDPGPAPTERPAGPGQRAITRFGDANAAAAASFEPQTASALEPWVFCVPTAFNDPKQSGALGHGRRPMEAAAFDASLEEASYKASRSMITRRPAERRQDAGRNPQQQAGNKAAAEWMGNGARAHGGALASHEYCHLVGDGDGGACDERNLVVGTNSVNTEQLALEETLRPFRPRFRRLGWSIMIDVTATLDGDPAQLKAVDTDITWPSRSVADHIRYRITAMPMDVALVGMHRKEILTHIMDGKRGTITEMEVELLKAKVTNAFEAVATEVEADAAGYELSDEWAGVDEPDAFGNEAQPAAVPHTPNNVQDDATM